MNQSNKSQALKRIRAALDQIPNLKEKRNGSIDFDVWKRDTRNALASIFGDKSTQVQEFNKVSYSPYVAIGEPYAQDAYARGLDKALGLLQSMSNEITEFWPENSVIPKGSPQLSPAEPVSTAGLFLVHGRDHGTRDTVAKFLSDLGIEAIVLEDQPNAGRTVIEKLEEFSNVGYAIVLCTPDDVGALADDPGNLRPRPRQNVVQELGYFHGRLGRDRVGALIKGELEMPSDFDGVAYIRMDDVGGWKLKLIRELRAAGFDVDANLVT